jgi:cytochrome c-type biogenesis protein CcmH/NrfG
MDAWMKSVADPSCTERATQIAQRAAERFPENPRILFYFGCLLVRQGQLREAETTMRRVLKLDPDHIEAQYELRKLQRQASSQSQTRPAIMGLFGSKKSNSG